MNRRFLLSILLHGSAATLLLVGRSAQGAEKNAYQVNSFVGSFSTGVPIAVPPYHGLEPRLSLSYTSEGHNGPVGMGWTLSGFSQIQGIREAAVNPASGWPAVLFLDGQELVACPAGSSYPSCASGGTHYTRHESYLKIVKVDNEHWTVYGKDGTQTKFTTLGATGDYPWKFGQTQTVDTHGNTVNYTWWNPDGGVGHAYPSTASYNGYAVEFLYETRPDVIYSPVRYGEPRVANRRLKTVKVRLTSGALIRAYKLTYATSAQSGKSLLTSVQQFGKDATFDGTGSVTGGTSLPAQTFAYTADGSAATFGGDVTLSTTGPPATPAGTVENVVWTNLRTATGDGNNLKAFAGDPEFPNWKTGSASRTLSVGSGYAEATFWPSANSRFFYFGPVNAYIYPNSTGVSFYVPGVGYIGPYAVSGGQVIRITVTPTAVAFAVNGAQVASYSMTATYPVVLYAGIWGDNEVLHNVKLSGSLVNYFGVDCGGQPRFAGDFNGDGRQDFVCRNPSSGGLVVTLATATGFASPMIWGSAGESQIEVGDFTGDGKTDLLGYQPYWGSAQYYVYASTGAAFGAQAAWGAPAGYDPRYGWEVCASYTNNHLGPVGDFNGDGKADATCVFENEDGPAFLVSYSNGSAFSSAYQDACGPSPALQKLDWNGDGLEDLLCTSGGANPEIAGVYGIRPDYGILPLLWRNGSFCTKNNYWAGDVNGDGRSDIGCTYGNVVMGGAASDLANQGAFCTSGQTVIEDLDGDGAAEWICNNPGAGADDIQVRRWAGSAFGGATTWRAGFCGGLVKPGDLNGDGKTDLICESSGVVAYAGTKGVKGDIQYYSANGIGGSTTLAYVPSTNFSSLNGASPKYVISTVTQNDGRGGADVTSYAYENSFEDDKEKKWNGFSKVTTTHPMLAGETAAPTTVTGYNVVAGPAAGSVAWVEQRDGANRILSYSKNTYQTTTGARQTSLLNIVETEKYDGTTTARCTIWPCTNGRRTKLMYAYDGTYGNLTTAVNFGDVDVSGDEVTTGNYYAPNPAPYIVGLLGASNQFVGLAASGTILTSVTNAYDGAAAWNTPPVKGDKTKGTAWLNSENRTVATTATFDAYGNVTSSTDPTGRMVTATYDATYHLFPITATNAASESTSTTWDYLCAAPLTTTDANGQLTTLSYDALCRPTGGTGPLGSFETRSYLDLGTGTQRARAETPGPDGANDWSEAYFDGWGRTYRTIKRGPSATKSIIVDLQFDQRGNLSGQTAPYYADEAPKSTVFEYDGFNRLRTTTLPDDKTRVNSFPAMSSDGFFQSTQTNELGQSSTTKFDVFGRLRKEEKYTSLHGNLVTTRNYDILGRMTSLVDPASNTWSYTFDSLGRNLTKNDPDAGNWSFTYDDAGRSLTQTDAKSQTTTLTYDSIGRLSTKANPTETVTTTYSQARSGSFNTGRATTVASSLGNGTLQFDYDALGRVVKQTRTIDGTNYTVQKDYDTAGYLRGMQYPDGDIIGQFGGSGTALGYDQAGRLSSIPGILTSVTYNALGAPLVQTNANGTTTTKTYDADRFWLKTIRTTAPSLTPQDLVYTLNDAGMATQVTSPFGTEGWTYGYDELNRLTSSTNTGAPANNQTWTYDSLGRITNNSRIGNYTYGGSRPHAVTAAGSNTYTSYDNNGNLLLGGGRSLTWDANNMVTQVVMGGNTTTFTYGPDGDRIKKASSSTTLRYPFGDDYEINGSTVTKYFNAGFGVIAKKVATTLYWLHTDRMGSINATTDGSGAEVLRRSYRSYGELLGQTGTDTESLGYIGQRTDSETGLTYLHARYYDPALGMFLSPDPIGADLNTYRYASGNPANFSDPSGLLTAICTGYGWGSYNPDDSDFQEEIVYGCNNWYYEFGGFGWNGPSGGSFGSGGYSGGGESEDPGRRGKDGTPKTCEELGNCPVKTCEELGNCPVKTCQELGTCPVVSGIPPVIPPYETPVPTEAQRLRNGVGLILLGEAVHQAGNRLPCGAFRANARGVSTLINAAAAIELGLSAARIGLTLAAVPHPAATIVGGGLVAVGVAVSGGFALSQAVDDMWDPTCG